MIGLSVFNGKQLFPHEMVQQVLNPKRGTSPTLSA
jgi:hypothetical protein